MEHTSTTCMNISTAAATHKVRQDTWAHSSVIITSLSLDTAAIQVDSGSIQYAATVADCMRTEQQWAVAMVPSSGDSSSSVVVWCVLVCSDIESRSCSKLCVSQAKWQCTLLVITRVCYACRVVVAVMRSLYQKLDAVQILKLVCTLHKQHARIR
eukprot:20347-Heterococcus_DN1.PRE.1